MAEVRFALFLFLLTLLSVSNGHAETSRSPTFEQWLQNLQADAVEQGISVQTAQAALANVYLDDHVIELDQKQPEKTATFASYITRILTQDRIDAARRNYHENEVVLNDVAARYGVDPQIIVALWGMESSFGRNSGDYSIINSLATLAFDGRRADFFRKELINALLIVDQQHIAPEMLRGSWAGAMGQCQFMPSTYLHYAVSLNGGAPDIWENPSDVFASIAHFIAADGWKGGQPWGFEVRLQRDLSSDVGLDHKRPLTEWKQLGVTAANRGLIPDSSAEASLVAPDGADGRHFLVYDNFRALMRWNRSTFFATSVAMLADRIN